MRRDAVAALVAAADGQVEHLFRSCVEGPWRHDFFHAQPGPAERHRIVSNRLPEVIDPVGLSSRHDVVVHGSNFGRRRVVLKQTERGHVLSPREQPPGGEAERPCRFLGLGQRCLV